MRAIELYEAEIQSMSASVDTDIKSATNAAMNSYIDNIKVWSGGMHQFKYVAHFLTDLQTSLLDINNILYNYAKTCDAVYIKNPPGAEFLDDILEHMNIVIKELRKEVFRESFEGDVQQSFNEIVKASTNAKVVLNNLIKDLEHELDTNKKLAGPYKNVVTTLIATLPKVVEALTNMAKKIRANINLQNGVS